MQCKLCDFTYKNNLGGDLTKHVKLFHNIDLYQYVIKTEYNQIPPTCACGCGQIPLFYRGKFKRHVTFHDTVELFNTHYIERNGLPKCKYCDSIMELDKFRKKIPIFCDGKCSRMYTKSINPPKCKRTPKVKPKVLMDESYRKIRSANHKRSANKPETKLKHSIISKKMWADPEYKIKTSMKIKDALSTPEARLKRRNIAIELRKDPVICAKYDRSFALMSTSLSKVHLKWRTAMHLDDYGFVSEVSLHGYIPDELNKDMKLIIEVNGNYAHANPKYYKATDIITMPGYVTYTAQEKWTKDAYRQSVLESYGYYVFVIWEDDDFDDVYTRLHQIINIRKPNT